MHRLLGYLSIMWGAVKLRAGLVRPPVGSPAFFAYRQQWAGRILRSFGIHVEAEGPRPGPGTLVVANHSGFADIPTLSLLLPAEARANYISKLEIGKIPFLGWHMRVYGDVLFDRTNPAARKHVVEAALARLAAGFSVVLFPEGTRSHSGEPSITIRPALIEAALQAHVPIQPVAIHGTRDLLERPLVRKRGAQVHAHFGQVRRDFTAADEVWAAVLDLWRRTQR